jgi:predicted PurR-regulated permease PerM
VSLIARVLRLASIVCCLIVSASFLTFAVNQTKNASKNQQEELNGAPASTAATTSQASTPPPTASKPHESSVHKTLDEASDALTSPFSSVVASSSSEWVIHSVKLILALLVYGFALGFFARVLRVRS